MVVVFNAKHCVLFMYLKQENKINCKVLIRTENNSNVKNKLLFVTHKMGV